MPIDPTVAFASRTRTIMALSALVDRALAESELTPAQYRILGYCAHGPTTPSEVAAWLDVRKQSVTGHLDLLVDRGWVTRAPDPSDRRRSLHTATPAGIAALDAAEEAVETYLEVLLGTVPDRQAATVRRGLAAASTAFTRLLEQVRDVPPDQLQAWVEDRPGPG